MAPDSEPPAPTDVDAGDEQLEDDEDVVKVELSPEGGYVLQQFLEAGRAHKLYPYNYQGTPPDIADEDRKDLEDLRRLLRKNRFVRQVANGERSE